MTTTALTADRSAKRFQQKAATLESASTLLLLAQAGVILMMTVPLMVASARELALGLSTLTGMADLAVIVPEGMSVSVAFAMQLRALAFGFGLWHASRLLHCWRRGELFTAVEVQSIRGIAYVVLLSAFLPLANEEAFRIDFMNWFAGAMLMLGATAWKQAGARKDAGLG